MSKRYYWLKLKDDFFSSKRIKKLRNMAGGDTYTIIYLKMQLLAIKTDGVLTWTGLEDNFAEELALDLDERPEDVEVTLIYLLKVGLAETNDNKSFFFPYAVENTGSETAAAQRMRDMRERNAVTQGCNNVTPLLRERYVEKEIDTRDREKRKREDNKADKPPRAARFSPPSVEEVTAYCQERRNGVDAQRFVDFYASKGWKVGRDAMKDWRAAVRNWERRDDHAGRSDSGYGSDAAQTGSIVGVTRL